jgi:hypothetical protein
MRGISHKIGGDRQVAAEQLADGEHQRRGDHAHAHVGRDLDRDDQRRPDGGDRQPPEDAAGPVVGGDRHHDVLELVDREEDRHPRQREVEEAEVLAAESELEVAHQPERQAAHQLDHEGPQAGDPGPIGAPEESGRARRLLPSTNMTIPAPTTRQSTVMAARKAQAGSRQRRPVPFVTATPVVHSQMTCAAH